MSFDRNEALQTLKKRCDEYDGSELMQRVLPKGKYSKPAIRAPRSRHKPKLVIEGEDKLQDRISVYWKTPVLKKGGQVASSSIDMRREMLQTMTAALYGRIEVVIRMELKHCVLDYYLLESECPVKCGQCCVWGWNSIKVLSAAFPMATKCPYHSTERGCKLPRKFRPPVCLGYGCPLGFAVDKKAISKRTAKRIVEAGDNQTTLHWHMHGVTPIQMDKYHRAYRAYRKAADKRNAEHLRKRITDAKQNA